MKILKKLIICTLITCTLTAATITISAEADGKVSDEKITIIQLENNEEYTIPHKNLLGTNLEGKDVQIVNGVVYVNGERVLFEILVFVGGIAAGYLIDGALIYYTGYSGGELTAQALRALNNFANRNSNLAKVYLDNRSSTTVRSYITKNGQQCTLSGNGSMYVCAYSD